MSSLPSNLPGDGPHARQHAGPEKPCPPSGERRPMPWEKAAVTAVIVDEKTRVAIDQPCVDDGELKAVEHRTVPEGAPPRTGERHWMPALMVGLALVALAVVVTAMYLADGWEAAGIAAVWVMLFYAVSCGVVWGAGLMRARDEDQVVHRIEDGRVAPR